MDADSFLRVHSTSARSQPAQMLTKETLSYFNYIKRIFNSQCNTFSFTCKFYPRTIPVLNHGFH